jgi:putative ABC transport system permease protein
MHLVNYTSIAVKDLKRQKVRSSLTIFALVISTIILVIMAAISIGGQQAIIKQFGTDASQSVITVTPNQSSGTLSPFGSVQEVKNESSKLDDTSTGKLAAIPHVQSVTPRAHIWDFSSFTVAGNEKAFVAQADGVPFDALLPLKAGAHFTSNDTKNVAILGYGYAKELGYANNPDALVGKTITFTTQKGYRGDGATIPALGATAQTVQTFNQSTTTLPVTIVGVSEAGPDQNGVFIPLGWAHDIRTARYNDPAGLKTVDQLSVDGYTTMRVIADSSDNVKSVTNAIDKLGYGELSVKAQIQQLQQFTALMFVILGAVAIIAVVSAALGVVNTMLMAVSEQRYVIGVWRASGARKSFIIRLFLTEAALLGLIGGAIGVGLSIIISTFVNQYVNTLLAGQGLALTNIAVLPVWLLIGSIVLMTAFGTLAGLYPAYKAARQDPSQALSAGQ